MTMNLMLGDCLERMKEIPDGSVDMILADPPYGTTACKWDSVIDLPSMWEQLKRIIKPNGAIVMTASQPFTTILASSNMGQFRYEWIWQKSNSTGFQLAKKMPMKKHENILVFYKKIPTYNPQGLIAYGKRNRRSKAGNGGHLANECNDYIQEFTNYPTQLIHFGYDSNKLHPTQKPVALMEYLIKTYTDKGDLILDNCAGSGTTGVASKASGRNFVGCEISPKYYQLAVDNIEKVVDLFNENNEH